MMQSIHNRELVAFHGGNFPIRGTYHRASNEQAGVQKPGRLGVIFLNSLSLPRTATGDSSAEWADALAECGYPCFRVDLPGLGDSEGDLPADLLSYINGGGFAPAASSVAKEITERFDLAGVVLVGHCAGAVSAVLAAAKASECKGLILMDVYFHLPQAVRPKFRQYLSNWALKSAPGRMASNLYDRLRRLRLRVQANRLPENANLPLLRCWKQVASSGQPILMLKAPARKAIGTKARVGEFDYLQYALKTAGPQSQVIVKFAEGTDHSFANRLGRAAVRQEMGSWLEAFFPAACPAGKGTVSPISGSPVRARPSKEVVVMTSSST